MACSVAAGALAIAVLGCGAQSSGSGGRPPARSGGAGSPTLRRSRSAATVTVTAAGELPAAVADAASVALDHSRLVLLGGLDAADTSTASITVLAGGSLLRRDALPIPQHDAQATTDRPLRVRVRRGTGREL